MRIHLLSHAVHRTLMVTAAFGLAATPVDSAFAQEQPTNETQEATTLDRIEVTGSRIRQVDTETAQPVLTISRQDIEKQGFQSVGDILQNITATGSPPISRASPLLNGEVVGGTFISLRNLGPARTLVLLNGKRLGISTSGLADVSSIPAAAVERIEVLKDGASSIYGSDAIAGAINVITRSNYEGASASAYYGQYSEGDGTITKGDFIIGFSGDRGSLTAAAEWSDEEEVFARNRPFSAFPQSSRHPFENWTTVGQFGGFTTTASTPIPGVPTGTRVILRDGGDPRNPADYRAQNVCVSVTAACPNGGSPLDKSNTNQQTHLRTPLQTKSLYVDGIYNFTDNVRFRTNLLYSNRVAQRQVAGFPLQATSVVAFPAPLSAQSHYNPTGAAISNWWRRTWEIPRTDDADLQTYRFSGAFEGSFEWAERLFDWDVSYLNNSNKLSGTNYGNINGIRLQRAVGPSFLNAQGRVQCGTAAAPIGFDQCVPFNPFLAFGREGSGGLTNNPDLQNFLFPETHSTGETETTLYAANLTGELLTLPGGMLAFAAGVEHRKESGEFVPDALNVIGATTNLAAGPTQGGYSVDEIYAELQVPVLSDVPLAQELSLSLASRYSEYDTFGETTNSKFGFKWKPLESVLVRGTWAEGFRAPTIADLFGGGSQTFSRYTDPCDTVFGESSRTPAVRERCRQDLGALADTFRQLQQGNVPTTTPEAQTPLPFISGSNPLLTPETAVSKTLGVVWSPGFIQGLNVALDWWNIRIENTVVGDLPSIKLNDCYVARIASRCSGFTRDPVLGIVDTLSFGTRNAGFRDTEGFDFDLNYRLATEDWGKFSAAWNTTYTSKDVQRSTNDDVPVSTLVGIAGSSSQGITTFRIRSNFNLTWENGAFGISWMARYFSPLKEGCPTFPGECTDPNYGSSAPNIPINVNRFGSNTFHDLQLRWTAPWDATVSVGANNLFGHTGPVMYGQPSANVTYYGGYDIGRFVYMRYTQKF